jgi:competence protein ComEA
MFSSYTTREKRMMYGIAFLLILLISGWFSFGGNEQENEEAFLPKSPTLQSNELEKFTEDKARGIDQDKEEVKEDDKVEIENPGLESDEWMIDIKGAVQNPNIYRMEDGERVHDAIMKAGGLTEEAVTTYINLAEKVSDGMVIYIPTKQEVSKEKESGTSLSTTFTRAGENQATNTKSKGTTSEMININTAPASELENLPGIGASRAEAIVAYREEKGGFRKKEELMNISGIGPKIFEKMKNHIEL